MAETPASLRWEATTLERRAVDALDLSDLLERHHEDLRDRLQRVASLHTADVWDSAAARRSRRTLAYGGVGHLNRARDELFGVVAALRRHATDLESDARSLRRRAAALEAQQAAEQEAAAIADALAGAGAAAPAPSAAAPPSFF